SFPGARTDPARLRRAHRAPCSNVRSWREPVGRSPLDGPRWLRTATVIERSPTRVGPDRERLHRRLGMSAAPFTGSGTAAEPWILQTPSLGSEIRVHRDEHHDPPV